MQLPKYGDEVSLYLGAGELTGIVMHIDDMEIEVSPDGGDTSQTVYLDDLVDLIIM